MEVDVLDFLVPVENNKTLFVWNIQPDFTEAHIHERLHAVFSSFGPLYLLKVRPNAALSTPGFNGMVKFYSAAQARKAQRNTDGRALFQNTPLKVRLSSKQTPHFLSGNKPLSHARCVELANECLGFNGWTCDIITLKELPCEEEEEAEAGAGGRVRVKLGCVVQISFPRHSVSTRGAAVVEEDVVAAAGPEALLQKRSRMHKLVRDKAAVQAFSTVVLVLLGEGKVTVEPRRSAEHLFSEESRGIVRVRDRVDNYPANEDLWEHEDLDLTVW
ncbi:RAD52 motif-containing protein 1 isoform X2 [Phyllopteryx taeniolatus]|uniref:RAD52 motif-containing protein 1 isoform X2 n=1 Tax=Phyllopteryx taeniolatus TaxID=161469 RepID=UPI002AD444E1|nr:RAD52 motif-containing protein 1 isoform X2 [Phyllopteryx taeniolatus]